MSELEFFNEGTPLPLAAVAEHAGAHLPHGVDPNRMFHAIAGLDRAGPRDVAAFTRDDDSADLVATRAGACFVAARHRQNVPPHTIVLETEEPLVAFARLAAMLYPRGFAPRPVFEPAGIDPAAIIHGDASLEQRVVVDPGVVIGPRAEIGAGTTIGANSVIGAGVRVGRDCRIDSQVSIRAALIGDRVVIHAGARIGLGRIPAAPDGTPVPGLGRVVVQDDVEIGANAVIERGCRRDTMIGEGSRIGTLIVISADTLVDRLESR